MSAYQPRPDLAAYLVNTSPPLGSAVFDMVVYWQWVHAGGSRSAEQAWADLRMTPAHATAAIALRIVPAEIYELAAARAAEEPA